MENTSQKLRDFAADELPREKLLQKGRTSLSDEELIAIFLRTGIKGCNVLELATRLKKAAGTLTELGRMEAGEIMRCCKGIGAAKAATLAAVFELGQRAVKEEVIRSEMSKPDVIYRYLAGELRYEHQEIFVVLLLDSRRHLIKRCTVSKGTVNRTIVHPRDVYREAVICGACSVVAVHNHPTGNPDPSKQDRELTKTLADAGDTLCIPLLDHIIIGAESSSGKPYYSFRENGFILT